MTRRVVPLRSRAAVVVLAVAASACGVTTEDRPRPIDRKDVPFGLLEEAPSSPVVTSTTTSSPTRS